jgi:hypothetical protein
VDVDGRRICEVCRSHADVFAEPGSRREGIRVTIDQEAVCLAVDVFSGNPSRNWLDAASARHLASVLNQRAAELERGPDDVECGLQDETPGEDGQR